MALAIDVRPLSEDALLDDLCAGRVLVVGSDLVDEAERLTSSPLLAGLKWHVDQRRDRRGWEVY